MQFYDPNQLIGEVQELLRRAGLDAAVNDTALALSGAAMLLRGLGATPALDPVDGYSRAFGAGTWADADDRRNTS